MNENEVIDSKDTTLKETLNNYDLARIAQYCKRVEVTIDETTGRIYVKGEDCGCSLKP